MTTALEFDSLLKVPAPIKVAGRSYTREKAASLGQQSFFLPFEMLAQRPDFNGRIVYNKIEELAESILATGLNQALIVDIVAENDTAYVEVGNRRYRALKLLWEQGKLQGLNKPGVKNGTVECLKNVADMTDLQRFARIITSNNQEPLTFMEIAMQVLRIKQTGEYKKNEDIGKLVGYSRQSVENMLILAQEPQEIQQAIWNETLKTTAALKLVRLFPKEADRIKLLLQAKQEGIDITIQWVEEMKAQREMKKPAGSVGNPPLVMQQVNEMIAKDFVPAPPEAAVIESPAALKAFQQEHEDQQEEQEDELQYAASLEPDTTTLQQKKAALYEAMTGQPLLPKVAPYDSTAEDKSRVTSPKSNVRPGEIDKGIMEGNMETAYSSEVIGYFDQIWAKIDKLQVNGFYANAAQALKAEIQLLCSLGTQRMEIIKEFTVKAKLPS